MSKQDRQGIRSPADLERKYDLAAIAGLKKAAKNSEEGINKINKTMEEFVALTLGNFENMQNQIDGNITTHFYSGVPVLENMPASEWITEEEKNNHLGDLYYDKDTGYAYRFALDNLVYCWLKLTDSDISEALAIANSAKDTADGKRRVFTEQPAPPYDNGDLWFHEKEIFICQYSKLQGEAYENGDFVTATKYTDDTEAKRIAGDLEEFMKSVEANYSTTVEMESAITKTEEKITTSVNKTIKEKVDVLQQQIDGAVETFSGSEEPTLENIPARDWTTDMDKDKHIGDLYIVNSEGGDYAGFYYRFEKTNTAYQWVLLKDNEITKALQDAKEANERATAIEQNIKENYSTTVEMQSKIDQSAEEINLEVSKKVGTDEVVAAVNVSTEKIHLKGKRFVLEAENLTIDENGKIVAIEGTFKGLIESYEGCIGSWNICDVGFYNDKAKMGLLTDLANFGTGIWYIGETYEELVRRAQSGLDTFPPFMVNSAGNVYVQYLYSKGDVEAEGNMYATAFIPWSQAEKKKNFELLKNGLDILKKIDIYKYNYRTETDGTKKHIGFVIGDDYKYTEEVTSRDNTGADVYSLVGVCVKAIQELQAEIQELKKSKNN